MTSLSYRKHYPPGAARAGSRRHLLAVVRRVPGRRTRWQRQAQRRRPWLLRPLTPAERSLLQLRALADELTDLLAPYRQTRPRGHEDLRSLLHDLDTRPTLVAQVHALQACLDRLTPVLTLHGQQVSAWRQEWEWATEARRHELRQVHKAFAINGWVKGLAMLSEEAQQDIRYIHLMLPEAFTATIPTPTPAPTPYS